MRGRGGLLRSAVAVALGLSRRRQVPPPRTSSRDSAVAGIEAPLPADNLLQFGRAYQLPPSGRGNGLEALFWAPAERLPADVVDEVLAVLRERDVPAWVAPARLPGASRSAAPHDLWVGSDRLHEAEDLVMEVRRRR